MLTAQRCLSGPRATDQALGRVLTNMAARILLADDHVLFREGIRALLETHGLEVVGEAGTGIEALERAREMQPDVILLDLDMPEMGGLEATRLLKIAMPEVPIVILTGSEHELDLFEAVKSGAQGYLLKTMDHSSLIEQVESALSGEAALTPTLATKILAEFARQGRQLEAERDARRSPTPHVSDPNPMSADDSPLSFREHEVLEQLIKGATNKEIAQALIVSENTVKYHLKNILQKLHVNNRAQVVAYAMKRGFTPGRWATS